MKNIKVLGPGCANCKTTVRLIDEVAKEFGAEVQLEKVEEITFDFTTEMSSSLNALPAQVLDPKEELIHHRLFREHCYVTEDGIHIKDLRVIANRNNIKDKLTEETSSKLWGWFDLNGYRYRP